MSTIKLNNKIIWWTTPSELLGQQFDDVNNIECF